METKNAGKGKGQEQMDVRALRAMATEAQKQAEAARKQARLAKAKFKEARKLFKLSKRAARLARKEAKAAARVLEAQTSKPAHRRGTKRRLAKRQPKAGKRRAASPRRGSSKPPETPLPLAPAMSDSVLTPDLHSSVAQP